MLKKISLTLCAALLFAAGALTAYVQAQKKDAPAEQPDKHDAKTHAECPFMRDGHDAHLAEVNARGAAAMGFSQTETAHHFRLTSDGGAIEVEVRDAADTADRERVRQ